MVSKWLVLIAFLTACQILLSEPFEEEILTIEPENQLIVLGDRASICCRKNNRTKDFVWTFDGVKINAVLTSYEYKVIEDFEKNKNCIEIQLVLLKHEGKYRCYTDHTGLHTRRSRESIITVLVPPREALIIQGQFLSLVEDAKTHVVCKSREGKPAAEIIWLDGFGRVLPENASTHVRLLSDGKRYTVTSVLNFTPKKYHHNTTITCLAKHDALPSSAELKLHVKYMPKVSVKVVPGSSPSGRILEGEDVTFLCEADANPSPLSYKWYINENIILKNLTRLTIQNVTCALRKVGCLVDNSLGQSDGFKILDVVYKMVDKNSSEIYRCQASSSSTEPSISALIILLSWLYLSQSVVNSGQQ